jgi:hypothetical protein
MNATISHLREHIRTRSSRANLPGSRLDVNRVRALVGARLKILSSIWGLRKLAIIQFSTNSTLHIHPRTGEFFRVSAKPTPVNRKNPPPNQLVSDTTARRPSQPGPPPQLTAAVVRCTADIAPLPGEKPRSNQVCRPALSGPVRNSVEIGATESAGTRLRTASG